MNNDWKKLLSEHQRVTRRWFVKTGVAGSATLLALRQQPSRAEESQQLGEAAADLEPYLTSQDDFRDVSRGKPKPHRLPAEKKQEVGLTRETWRLEVTSDPEHPTLMSNEMTKADHTAFKFSDLMRLAQTHAIRFPKVMTCLNIGCPLGMGIWEGVPLREVLWLAKPKENLRRIFYYGYHNDDPKQLFQSSLPVGRVLEDLYGLPPVILCYKLNGQWLTPERGGPVRVVVPEAYGFKSIKWLSNLVLSNISYANDTYAEQNNDVDSPLKSFAATLSVPTTVQPNVPFTVTGYAQVGVSGVSKVQTWVQNDAEPWDEEDRYYTTAPWRDAKILAPPTDWGGDLPDQRIPEETIGFLDQTPINWPMKLAKIHWATVHPGLSEGEYTLRSRTIDANGHPQPMPRPFRKSGHAGIESIPFTVAAK